MPQQVKLSELISEIQDTIDQPQQVLELGTSLGMTTAYLAAAKSSAEVVTIEGSPAIAKEARYHFFSLKLNNIRQITGCYSASG